MVLYDPQTGDRTIGPFQQSPPAPTAGTCKHRSQSASASTSFFVVPKLRVSATRRAGSLSDGTRIPVTSGRQVR
jgi:hypothetical protein